MFISGGRFDFIRFEFFYAQSQPLATHIRHNKEFFIFLCCIVNLLRYIHIKRIPKLNRLPLEFIRNHEKHNKPNTDQIMSFALSNDQMFAKKAEWKKQIRMFLA